MKKSALIFSAAAFLLNFAASVSHAGPRTAFSLTKMWWWQNEVQLQIDNSDRSASFIFNLKLYNDQFMGGSFDQIGDTERPFLDFCHMKDMLREAMRGGAARPEVTVYQTKRANVEATQVVIYAHGVYPVTAMATSTGELQAETERVERLERAMLSTSIGSVERLIKIVSAVHGCPPLDYEGLPGFRRR